MASETKQLRTGWKYVLTLTGLRTHKWLVRVEILQERYNDYSETSMTAIRACISLISFLIVILSQAGDSRTVRQLDNGDRTGFQAGT